jgi:ribosome-associated protein
VLLDIGAVAGFTDYFLIATATSSRQFEALAEAVQRAAGPTPSREGSAESGWQLFDYGDLVVHIFGRQERAYYNLEALWSAGRQLLRIE